MTISIASKTCPVPFFYGLPGWLVSGEKVDGNQQQTWVWTGRVFFKFQCTLKWGKDRGAINHHKPTVLRCQKDTFLIGLYHLLRDICVEILLKGSMKFHGNLCPNPPRNSRLYFFLFAGNLQEEWWPPILLAAARGGFGCVLIRGESIKHHHGNHQLNTILNFESLPRIFEWGTYPH